MEKPTLDQFIQRVRTEGIRGNEWVLEPKFSHLYVRYGHRYIKHSQYNDVLDLATLEVEKIHRRTGVFTSLVSRLRRTYPGMHLFVENAQPGFWPLLTRLGFSAVPYESFFMEGEKR